MQFINAPYTELLAIARREKRKYASTPPFPNISFPNFFNPDMLDGVLKEFPVLTAENAHHFKNHNELKLASKGTGCFGPNTRAFVQFLNSAPFIDFLQELTGIEEKLIADHEFLGGGLHEIKKGGFLKLHADFNKNSNNLDRRLNILIYMNKDWKNEYGGHFELWDKDLTKCVQKVAPNFNTLALFTTTDFSYHGHPDPLNCPDDMSRKSLALYYYSDGRPQEEVQEGATNHSTIFVARKGFRQDRRKRFTVDRLMKMFFG